MDDSTHTSFFKQDRRDQYLKIFARLRLELTDQPLSQHALSDMQRREYGQIETSRSDSTRSLPTKLMRLWAGYEIAEITVKSYQDAVRSVLQGLAVGFMPFSTNDEGSSQTG